MTAYNIAVTDTWSKVADAANENVLVTWETQLCKKITKDENRCICYK